MRQSRIYFHFMWFWCWACYRAYLVIPIAYDHDSLYGRVSMWILGHAGAYANSDKTNFHLCKYFWRSDEDQKRAVEAWIAAQT